MPDRPPGLRPQRLLALARRSIETMALDLAGTTVLTEAATGAYAVTPVLAAMGGATVTAVTRESRFGSFDDVVSETRVLAELAGVAERIAIVRELTQELVSVADIVTNSGHVRPIDDRLIGWMRPTCVVPLMFESWEIDAGRVDVDLGALQQRGIRFAGTNERHPAVDVFSYLGSMAVKLLSDAHVAVYGARILVLCDNPFMPYLEAGVRAGGASVVAAPTLSAADLSEDLDAIVVALTPREGPVLSRADLELIATAAPGVLLAQFWGDVDRSCCDTLAIPCAPTVAPAWGHMGVLPSSVGPEPVVRLQAGGLKVASILRRPETEWTSEDRRYVDAY